jgi:site-specific DNA recombinase
MRVAIYARVSTSRQAQTQTIEQQLVRLVSYVGQQGWELPESNIFRDDGHSGASLNRPGLDSLRDRIAAREIERLVITAPDRLARNYVHQMVLLEEWEKYGCRMEFLDRPLSQDPHDQLVLQIRGAVAEYERTLIADRMRRGRQAKYRAGILLPWTKPVYGYQVDPDKPRDPAKVTLNEAEAAIIREMFAYYLQENTSLYGLVKHLYEMSIPAPEGGEYWNTTTVRGILTNPAYTGKVYVGRTRIAQSQKRRSATHPVGRPYGSHTPVAPEDWTPVATIPAIVDQRQFDLISTKLSRNKQLASRNNTAHLYLLKNLVSCAVCNLSCTARQLNPGYTYYVCRGKQDLVYSHVHGRCTARYIPAQQLDELVWNDLCEILIHPEIINTALQRAQGGAWLPQELQARRENLRRGQVAFQTQLDQLTEAYLNGVIPLPEYHRRRVDLDGKRQGLEDLEKQLDNQVDRQKELIGLAASVEEFCNRVRIGLENTTFDQKRKLVELLIDRVVVKNGGVEIRYVIPTGPSGEHIPFCHLRKDYFRPHPPPVGGQCQTALGQIGSQTPRLRFAPLPMDQQVDLIHLALRQTAFAQPASLPALLQITAKILPGRFGSQTKVGVGFLAQDIIPMPRIQLAQHFHRSKLAIPDQQHCEPRWQQRAHVFQQGHLPHRTGMTFDMPHPGPGNGNGPFAIRQADHQQLVAKPDLGAIYQQAHLLQAGRLGSNPFPGQRFVPLPHIDRRVVQKTAQAAGQADQLGRAGNFAGDAAQAHRARLINAHHQPGEVPHLGNALSGTRFLDSANPGMIEGANRHRAAPGKMVSANQFYRSILAD